MKREIAKKQLLVSVEKLRSLEKHELVLANGGLKPQPCPGSVGR